MNRLAWLLMVLLAVLSTVSANVIGIDFASDSMKIAIIQPGTPLEIGDSYKLMRSSSCVNFLDKSLH